MPPVFWSLLITEQPFPVFSFLHDTDLGGDEGGEQEQLHARYRALSSTAILHSKTKVAFWFWGSLCVCVGGGEKAKVLIEARCHTLVTDFLGRLRQRQFKVSLWNPQRSYLKIKHCRAAGTAQGQGPTLLLEGYEFNPKYCQKEKKEQPSLVTCALWPWECEIP